MMIEQEYRQALVCLEIGKGKKNLPLVLQINDDNTDAGIEGKVVEDVNTNTAYVWFEPTNCPSDWWINFNAWAVKTNHYDLIHDDDWEYTSSRIHKGWADAFERIRGFIHTIPDLIDPQISNIIITGHSLGAAMATLCSLYMKKHFPKYDYQVYLFGSPKVGNESFINIQHLYVPRTYNFQYRDDLVTKVPYSWLVIVTWCLYKKTGNVLHLGPKQKWYRFLIGRLGQDHHWSDYYNAIKKELERYI